MARPETTLRQGLRDAALALAAFAATLLLMDHLNDGSARNLDVLGGVLGAVASLPLLAPRGGPGAGWASAAVNWRRRRSGRGASAVSRPPRSARGSRATCTTPRRTRST